MADLTYTDEFGYPLSSVTVLRRLNRRKPIFTGAVERAGFGQTPVTVHQVAEAIEKEKEGEDVRRV